MMRAFMAVAQEGSFTAAGRKLGRSTKLVSKQVAALESEYQVQLLNRTTRSVALTATGTAYLNRCRHLVEEFDELDALVTEGHTSLSGSIRITAPTGFGAGPLSEALAGFMAAHPNISVDLHLTNLQVALVEEGFDLAVRVGIPRDSTLMVRHLAPMPLVTCAAPSYLAAHGTPSHPKALATHRCMIDRNMGNPSAWSYWSKNGERTSISISGPVTVNAPAASATFARAGLGIARCPLYQVAKDLESGALVPLLPAFRSEEFSLFALYPPTRNLTARIRALIDHLADQFSGDNPYL